MQPGFALEDDYQDDGQDDGQGDDQRTSNTMMSDVMANLANDNMTDFHLVSKDNIRVPASRFILGARSPIFRDMLFGNGLEARSTDVHIGYSGVALQALVEFCCTDDIQSFIRSLSNGKAARELVYLYDCARWFQLGGLEERVCGVARKLSKGSWTSNLACAVFDESLKHEASTKIRKIALAAIRSNPEVALLNQTKNTRGDLKPLGVSFLEQSSLREILSDKAMSCEEIIMFRVIMTWANVSLEPSKKKPTNQRLQRHREPPALRSQRVDVDRIELAKEYVNTYIDLTKVAPSNLMGIVTESGLCDQGEVWDAISGIAVRLEKEQISSFSKQRNGILTEDSTAQIKNVSRSKPHRLGTNHQHGFATGNVHSEQLVSVPQVIGVAKSPPSRKPRKNIENQVIGNFYEQPPARSRLSETTSENSMKSQSSWHQKHVQPQHSPTSPRQAHGAMHIPHNPPQEAYVGQQQQQSPTSPTQQHGTAHIPHNPPQESFTGQKQQQQQGNTSQPTTFQQSFQHQPDKMRGLADMFGGLCTGGYNPNNDPHNISN